MTWSDVTRPPKPKVVRQFGVVCLVVFGVLGLVLALAKGRTTLGYSLVGLISWRVLWGLLGPRSTRHRCGGLEQLFDAMDLAMNRVANTPRP